MKEQKIRINGETRGKKMHPDGFNIADYLPEVGFADVRIEENEDSSDVYIENISREKSILNGKPCLENLSTGEYVYIEKFPAIIGISENCDVILKDKGAESYISRKHAVIDIVRGRYAIKDISTNGSFFIRDDGKNPTVIRLSKDSFTELKNKQIVRFAKRNFRFILKGAER